MVERGITHLVIDATKYNGSEAFEFDVIQELIVETTFWRQYRCLQPLTGLLAYGVQSVQTFDIGSLLSLAGLTAVAVFSLLEKVDFVKDIQVAWAYPHASALHAFLMWFSISVPLFTALLYFVYIG